MNDPFGVPILRDAAAIIRNAIGYAYVPILSQQQETVVFDLDAVSTEVEAAFDRSSAIEPVQVRHGEQIIATMDMVVLATLLMRNKPSTATRNAILSWTGRSSTYWCTKGAHVTLEDPCSVHGA